MTADFLWPIVFQNLDLFLRQWEPLLTEKEICLTTTSLAETEIIIRYCIPLARHLTIFLIYPT